MVIDLKSFAEFFADKVAEKVAEKITAQEQPKEDRGNRIDGMRGLSSFLECSLSKAQDLKNKGIIPFYNIGKKVYFFENEVNNALKGR